MYNVSTGTAEAPNSVWGSSPALHSEYTVAMCTIPMLHVIPTCLLIQGNSVLQLQSSNYIRVNSENHSLHKDFGVVHMQEISTNRVRSNLSEVPRQKKKDENYRSSMANLLFLWIIFFSKKCAWYLKICDSLPTNWDPNALTSPWRLGGSPAAASAGGLGWRGSDQTGPDDTEWHDGGACTRRRPSQTCHRVCQGLTLSPNPISQRAACAQRELLLKHLNWTP